MKRSTKRKRKGILLPSCIAVSAKVMKMKGESQEEAKRWKAEELERRWAHLAHGSLWSSRVDDQNEVVQAVKRCENSRHVIGKWAKVMLSLPTTSPQQLLFEVAKGKIAEERELQVNHFRYRNVCCNSRVERTTESGTCILSLLSASRVRRGEEPRPLAGVDELASSNSNANFSGPVLGCIDV